MITEQSIVDMVLSKIEPLEPADTILRVLQENDGKRFDKRLVEKIKEAVKLVCPTLYVRESNNLVTQIVWGETVGFCRGSQPRRFTLLIAYKTKSVHIDAAWVKEHNPAYFVARDERNRCRKSDVLHYRGTMALCANKINAFNAAHKELKEIFRVMEYDGFTDMHGLRDLVPAFKD